MSRQAGGPTTTHTTDRVAREWFAWPSPELFAMRAADRWEGGNRLLRVEGYAPTGSFFRVATHLPGTMREEATVTTVTKQERAHGLTRDS